jgi:two-component system, OmpR family, phosphate regulon sensor histidine kinase PhoR
MKFPLKVSSVALALYLMAAFAWWAILLWRSNEEKLRLETQLLAQNAHVTVEQYRATPEYAAMFKKHKRYAYMIMGEGLFFIACLVIGLRTIRRTSQREMDLARQRRNFLLSITHELKSPIAAMKLVLETIWKRELNREQTQQLTSGGLKDATRLQNLVQDMLLAARLEDSWHPHYTPMNLHALVEECTETLLLRFPMCQIVNKVEQDLPAIDADKQGFTAVVMNLMENAIKYSPKGTPVEIAAFTQKNGKMRITVADQGKGIPKSEHKSVFDKFYRLGNEETRQATGTGLGLYIVKQVLEAHKGSVQILPNQPQGTIFAIDI